MLGWRSCAGELPSAFVPPPALRCRTAGQLHPPQAEQPDTRPVFGNATGCCCCERSRCFWVGVCACHAVFSASSALVGDSQFV